jgi:plasmid rolling circle replication initiator protein Rep
MQAKTIKNKKNKKNQEINDWAGKRKNTEKLAKIYKEASIKIPEEILELYAGEKDFKKYQLQEKYLNKSDDLNSCSTILTFVATVDELIKKLKTAYFCRKRDCPICAWRRSLKTFGQTTAIMNHIDANYDFKYIFLTVSAKNVEGRNLSKELDKLIKTFGKLTHSKKFKAVSKGWFRSLEITRNWEDGTYHPHFHIIICVEKSYFKNRAAYLNHSEWTELWRKCYGMDYTPIVFVQTIKPDETGGIKKAIAEVSKYVTKDIMPDENILSKETKKPIEKIKSEIKSYILTLNKVLYKRRTTGFGGVMKEVHNKLRLDDNEDGDLKNTHLEENKLRDDLFTLVIRYKWFQSLGEYINTSTGEILTDKKQRKTT